MRTGLSFGKVSASFLAVTALCGTLVEPQSGSSADAAGGGSRPFLMSFTPHPPDLSVDGIRRAYALIKDHADMITHHFDSGVPWPEAETDTPFPAHLRENWKVRKDNTPAGPKVYVAITPISLGRDGLALYWGRDENTPLPKECRKRSSSPASSTPPRPWANLLPWRSVGPCLAP